MSDLPEDPLIIVNRGPANFFSEDTHKVSVISYQRVYEKLKTTKIFWLTKNIF